MIVILSIILCVYWSFMISVKLPFIPLHTSFFFFLWDVCLQGFLNILHIFTCWFSHASNWWGEHSIQMAPRHLWYNKSNLVSCILVPHLIHFQEHPSLFLRMAVASFNALGPKIWGHPWVLWSAHTLMFCPLGFVLSLPPNTSRIWWRLTISAVTTLLWITYITHMDFWNVCLISLLLPMPLSNLLSTE